MEWQEWLTSFMINKKKGLFKGTNKQLKQKNETSRILNYQIQAFGGEKKACISKLLITISIFQGHLTGKDYLLP